MRGLCVSVFVRVWMMLDVCFVYVMWCSLWWFVVCRGDRLMMVMIKKKKRVRVQSTAVNRVRLFGLGPLYFIMLGLSRLFCVSCLVCVCVCMLFTMLYCLFGCCYSSLLGVCVFDCILQQYT